MSLSSLKILRLYKYDPLDRLTGVGFLQRFYQEGRLTTELNQQTQRTILCHQGQPLAQKQSEAGVTETTLLATDRAHSLLQTVSGVNQKQFAYTAYGHHPAESGLSRLLGFNGECPDDITGNYPLGRGNRFYNPVLMRFMTPDELSPFDDGGINAYAYCGGDPINFYDPTGNSLIALFRPWSFIDATPVGLNLIKRPSVIVKNPLHTIHRTASSINRSSSARNPILNGMLDRPASNAIRSAPSTSTSTSQLVNFDGPLPSTELLTKLIPDASKLTPGYRNLEYIGKVFDETKARNGNFRIVATRNQIKALRSHMARKNNAQNEITKKLHNENASELMLQIKRTSVSEFHAPTANQQIRR
ncbi:RHS repeat-associated core domain-containing protein [Pseudomonas sp. GM55]|uniref:RHS repeat-associated core domain-containing protein n=1 Tax=Pseudomonas sp. GM55 TaxID=1144333 RepID=UPI0002707F59|nr:RHS repeat-associated core domain-containing protein [Pseudomonas sp. GM55]EJM75584.1 RHS repeat-associated core domain protein-containing protein [Pseudomonas sp. GM55]